MGVGGDREKESSEKMVPVLLKMKWKCRHYWFYVFRFLNITDKIFFSSSPSKKKKKKVSGGPYTILLLLCLSKTTGKVKYVYCLERKKFYLLYPSN